METDFLERLKQTGYRQSSNTLNLQNCKLGNKYIIFQLIAAGKHSTIYKGINEATGVQFAFKFYNLRQIETNHNFRTKQICKRLSNYQYLIMSKCKSVNILKCLDIYEDRNYKVMVSEYCNMGSLRNQIQSRKGKATDQERAIIILKQIIAGVKSMHRDYQFLHKNLKSQNILVKNGIYKIIDFGMPNVLDQNQEKQEFVVPEIQKKLSYDSKAEVWSIGLLFLQILLGKVPQFITLKSNLMKKANDQAYETEFNQIKSKNQYSEQVYDFITNCLNLDPEERMTWQQLQNHPMFRLVETEIKVEQFRETAVSKNLQKNPKLKQNLLCSGKGSQKISIIIDLGQDISLNDGDWQDQFYSKKLNLQCQKKNIQAQLKFPYKNLGIFFQMKRLQRGTQQFFKNKTTRVQQQEYNKIKDYYLECLKIQFILEYIISPIIDKKLLDLEKREVKEFLYLLCSRCFTQISKINLNREVKSESEERSLLLSCVKKSIFFLYKQMNNKWIYFSQSLTEFQNKMHIKIFDYFKGKLNKQGQSKKDKYLVGIEHIDYQKEEQICYTVEFYNQYIQTWLRYFIKDPQSNQADQATCKQVMKYLNIYDKIWGISKQLQNEYPSIKCCIDKVLLSLQNPKQ